MIFEIKKLLSMFLDIKSTLMLNSKCHEENGKIT